MGEASAEKLKVFISYSRRDSSNFADELLAGLEVAGFAPFLDRHDIAPGEDWEARLGGLIEQADTVVFVVSPEAVKSERCTWEVDKALAEAKRVLPVIFKAVSEADTPHELKRRQFVRFDLGTGFARPLAQLAQALRQDIDWIREHTRLGELAARWDTRGRPESFLLRGEDVAVALTWAKKRKTDAPAITELMRAFIAASKDADAAYLAKSNLAQRRMIRMQALIMALLVLVIIGLVGWMNQVYIKEQWRWWTVTRPYAAAQVWPYVLSAAKEQALKPAQSFKECAADCPEMIVVPAGSFTMGSPGTEKVRYTSEGPQHKVTFSKPFAVARYELTFADWDACAAGGGCNGYKPADLGWGRGQQPVINVDWDDAQQYVAWLSQVTGKTYRLLSEAEYEYATRAGTTTVYPWGDDIKLNGAAMANCNGCGSKWDNQQTAPVGSFAPNKFGLYDMVGNVLEWTEDCAHSNYNGAPTDGSAWITGGDCSNRLLRGGSWLVTPDYLRSALRFWIPSVSRSSAFGFRPARTLDTDTR
jgi:formylglycine-generating enzyme required for sulfatase activity